MKKKPHNSFALSREREREKVERYNQRRERDTINTDSLIGIDLTLRSLIQNLPLLRLTPRSNYFTSQGFMFFNIFK